MLACRVLIGDIAKGTRNCEPPLKPDGHTRVETLVNDTNNPTIFVATRDYVALPVYYIWFSKASSKPKRKAITTSNDKPGVGAMSFDIGNNYINNINNNNNNNNRSNINGSTLSAADISVGSPIDYLDTELDTPLWYPANIIDIDKVNGRIFVQHVGNDHKFNRWISMNSNRVASRGAHTDPFPEYLTYEECDKLKVGDKIDHRYVMKNIFQS